MNVLWINLRSKNMRSFILNNFLKHFASVPFNHLSWKMLNIKNELFVRGKQKLLNGSPSLLTLFQPTLTHWRTAETCLWQLTVKPPSFPQTSLFAVSFKAQHNIVLLTSNWQVMCTPPAHQIMQFIFFYDFSFCAKIVPINKKCFSKWGEIINLPVSADEMDKNEDSSYPQPQRPLDSKWGNTNSDFPPKLKGQLSVCHLYLIYSLTVLCILLSTYTFSNTFKLQQEVKLTGKQLISTYNFSFDFW